MNKVEQAVRNFLKTHRETERPLLVGVSGGGDSLSLLHALHQLNIPLVVAHMDHRWRASSVQEADALEAYVKKMGLPFYRSEGVGKTEDAARHERLNFFKEVCGDAEALVLAHHADDLAETAFKRTVEGSALSKLGIRPVHQIEGLTIWRPLLDLPKSELKIPSLVNDPDRPDNHRGLLRTTLFPLIERHLERPIRRQLARLGRSSSELESYLESQVKRFTVHRGPFGVWIDLTEGHPMEWRHLLSKELVLSKEQQDLAIQLLGEKRANSQLSENIFIDRGHLLVIEKPEGSWELVEGGELSDWRGLWMGELSTLVPEGEMRLAPYTSDSRLNRLWTEHKVPACLRHVVPVIWQGDQIVGEFLTRNDQKGMVRFTARYNAQVE